MTQIPVPSAHKKKKQKEKRNSRCAPPPQALRSTGRHRTAASTCSRSLARRRILVLSCFALKRQERVYEFPGFWRSETSHVFEVHVTSEQLTVTPYGSASGVLKQNEGFTSYSSPHVTLKPAGRPTPGARMRPEKETHHSKTPRRSLSSWEGGL